MKHDLHRVKRVFTLAFTIGLSLACSNPGKSGGTVTPKAPDVSKPSEDASAIIPNPSGLCGR
jgi:hypothetical protein